MEIFELRYFLAVAKHENIHRAAAEAHVSPASLSKAVSRLEDELGKMLFLRVGRNIRLSADGRTLQRRASEILALTDATRLELQGSLGTILIRIAGPEVLLLHFALPLANEILASHPRADFELQDAHDAEALDLVHTGQADIAVVTRDIPRELKSKNKCTITFHTCLGSGHPLAKHAKSKRPVPINQVLEYPFAGFAEGVLGEMGASQSADGWRDDQFPRRIGFIAKNLSLVAELVRSGAALAYLPDYLIARFGFTTLEITGCPYICRQKVRLAANDPRRLPWLKPLFDEV